MTDPITRYMAYECLYQEVSEGRKAAKLDAEDYLAEKESEGTASLVSPLFPGAGEYKRGKSRAKRIVEYNLTDRYELASWMNRNRLEVESYILAHAEDFGRWCVDEHGELPDGIARVEYEEPPKQTAPKLYRFDGGIVKERLAELAGGNVLEGANQLLLES